MTATPYPEVSPDSLAVIEDLHNAASKARAYVRDLMSADSGWQQVGDLIELDARITEAKNSLYPVHDQIASALPDLFRRAWRAEGLPSEGNGDG